MAPASPPLDTPLLIAQKGHNLSFVSTQMNIKRLPKLPPKLAPLIKFISLPLPKVDNLPENAEATTDVPYEVVQYLKQAYDALQQPLTQFLKSSNADWIFYDFAPFWLPSITSKLGIKSAFFSIYPPTFLAFLGPPSLLIGNEEEVRTKPEDYTVPAPWVPFSTTVAFKKFEIMKMWDSFSENSSGVSDSYRLGACVDGADIVLVRGSPEFQPEWFEVLEDIYRKPVLPVGQLPSTKLDGGTEDDNMWRSMKEWLDKQARDTVVYVAFGSEAKPSQNEVALGLEKSELPFLWVLRIQRGPTDTVVLELPEGFEERTKGRGVVCTKWAPQLKILSHVAVGGSLTHSGWTSVVEAVQNEKPLVLLTFLVDQGINARVLEEKKMGFSVPRDEQDGSFTSDSVADSLRLVMVQEEGSIYKKNIKEMKDLFVNKDKQEKYIENLLNYIKSIPKY